MNTQLLQAIEASNKRTQRARIRRIVKRVNDAQILELLVDKVRFALDMYEVAGGKHLGLDLEVAMKDLERFVVIVGSRPGMKAWVQK